MDTLRHLLPSRILHGAEAALWTWQDSFLGGAGTGAPGQGGSKRLLSRGARGRGLGAARRHKGAASRLASRPLARPTAGAQSKSAKEAGEGVLRSRKGAVTKVLQVSVACLCQSWVVSTMDSARGPTLERLDAAGFWQVWQHFDSEGE